MVRARDAPPKSSYASGYLQHPSNGHKSIKSCPHQPSYLERLIFCFSADLKSVNFRRLHYAWVVVFMGLLTVLGAHGFGRYAYSLVLTDMKVALNLDFLHMGLIATANFIGYLASAATCGALASKHGPRKVIALSASIMGVSMILTGLSRSFLEVLTWRFLTGLGHGGAYLPAMALPSIWFALKLRGRATGYVSAGIGVGFALAGVIVPAVLLSYGEAGWRYVWFYLGATLLAIALVDFLFIRDRPEDMGLKPLGSEKGEAQDAGESSSLKWGLVYRSKEIWMVGLVYFMYGFSYIIYVTFFSAYLEAAFRWSKEAASGLWSLVGLLSIVSGTLWGWVSDVLGRRYGMALAYSVLALSYLLYALALPPYGLYASALAFGVTAWSIPTIAVVAAADYVGPELRPAAAGFVTLFFGIGQAIGPALGGFVIEATGMFANAFYVAFLVSTVGALSSLLLRKTPLK
jgi:sugar phosphate permease